MIPSEPRRGCTWSTITALIGLFTAGIGVWCLIDPGSFAEFVGFPAHEHFVHDVGAFQVGFGVVLLLALIWSDALATVLAGYIVANTVHTVNHIADLDLGGSALQAWTLGEASVALVIAFVLRLRQLNYVLGNVGARLTRGWSRSFGRRRSGSAHFARMEPPESVPSASRSMETVPTSALRASDQGRRIRRNPNVEFGSATMAGKPIGPMLPAQARLLEGAEYRQAARLLRHKYPFLHGVVVPSVHRLARSKYGRTVHAELMPTLVPAGKTLQPSCFSGEGVGILPPQDVTLSEVGDRAEFVDQEREDVQGFAQ